MTDPVSEPADDVVPEVDPRVDAARTLAVWGWQRETIIMDELEGLLSDAAVRRDRHVQALHETGLVYRDIGEMLGISATRVGQIMARINSRKPRPNTESAGGTVQAHDDKTANIQACRP